MNNSINTKTDILYSFDIFDTLVTRRVAEPIGIFAIMQKIIAEKTNFNDFIKHNFCKIRIGAEEFARFLSFQQEKCHEIKFDDIYRIIQNNCNLSVEEINFLKELELKTEIQNLVPIDKNLSKLKELINSNKRVVLISDMYFSKEYLQKILVNIDSVFGDITIYSSSDYKVSKADGDLYKIVRDIENVEYKNWTHYGDNKQSDVKRAKSYGINAIHTPQNKLTKYEEKLLKENEYNADIQAIIGSSKLAKQKRTGKNTDKYDFGASFAAPILYNYVDWVLNESLKRGFKTLYFVARDGYVPKVIADIIIEQKNLPIKTKYIYGSRLTWRVLTESDYDMLVSRTFEEYRDRLTPEFLAYRFGITADAMKKMLSLPTVKTKINHSQATKFVEKLKQDNSIKQLLLEASKKKVEILKKYLIQELDFSEDNFAFVDLHGSGRTQDCLAEIMNEIKPCKICSFYLSNSELKKSDISEKMSYFATLKYMSHWVELLCRTTDGQTIGYKQNENGQIVPITEEGNGKAMEKWGYYEYLEGIKTYTYNMQKLSAGSNLSFNTLDLYCSYFDYLLNGDLDKPTANILGDIPFLSIGNEDEKVFVAAPRIRTWRVLLNFVLCKKPTTMSEFPYISVARSSTVSQKLQKLIEDCPTLQKFLFNVYVHKKQRKAYIRIFGIKISIRRLLWN
ncbi:hypothetical protein J6O48_14215 [bacterium]|nr:hypothetical protein [bacterium]